MTLASKIRSDVYDIFLNEEEFAEDNVVYYLRDGGQRTIKAIVNRDPPEFYAAGNWVLPAFEVIIANDCSNGVSVDTINLGGDEVELLAEHGDTAKTRVTVIKVLEKDIGGIVKLALK